MLDRLLGERGGKEGVKRTKCCEPETERNREIEETETKTGHNGELYTFIDAIFTNTTGVVQSISSFLSSWLSLV